jgi:uncharacterized damage-inducible protein DinB
LASTSASTKSSGKAVTDEIARANPVLRKAPATGPFSFPPPTVKDTTMITPAYALTMARYNTWQNQNIYKAAARLGDSDRKAHRGAFFGSIHATLNHILWADQIWLSRFGPSPPPPVLTIDDSLAMFDSFEDLTAARIAFDKVIEGWAGTLTADALAGDLEFHSASLGETRVRPRAVLVMHLFNHQTHHRGQVHTLLTGFGVQPAAATDLWRFDFRRQSLLGGLGTCDHDCKHQRHRLDIHLADLQLAAKLVGRDTTHDVLGL